jgi:arsenite oxidase small subunit
MIFKLGTKVSDGVGPDGDVVAYSSICTHLGCAVAWNADAKVLSCPCHFSSFDPARGGIMIMGQATANLPQVILKANGTDLVATGIRGLIWGRQTNLQTLG